MRKVNNKGFTILEVIIAMAILSVIVFVGYKVINGSNKVTESQKNTSKGQLSTNLVNKYVSKDIEILEVKKDIEFKSKGITIESGSSKYTQSYTYTIDTVNHDEGVKIVDKVDYEVIHKGEIKDNKLNGVYSVNRKSKDEDSNVVSDIELVSNQKTIYIKNGSISVEKFLINNVKPFEIHKDNVDINIYTVGVHYESNSKEKNYAFDVSPRMSLTTIEEKPPVNPEVPEPPVEPEIDPDFDGNSAYIRFKYENGLAWSDAGPKGGTGNEGKGDPISDTKSRYKINAKLEPQNNAGFAEATLDDISEATAKNKESFPKGNYDQIKVSLFGDAILKDLTITVKYKKDQRVLNYKTMDKTIIIPIEKTIEENRKEEDQSLITIDGYLEKKDITSSYGDIIINLGHSK